MFKIVLYIIYSIHIFLQCKDDKLDKTNSERNKAGSIWAVLDVGVGVLAEAGEAVVVVVVVEAAEQHVGEDGLKR